MIFSVRLTEEDRRKLAELAAATGRKPGSVIRWLITCATLPDTQIIFKSPLEVSHENQDGAGI